MIISKYQKYVEGIALRQEFLSQVFLLLRSRG
jgi:hypothetical protein